jgi:hypothetical protein
MKPFLAFLLLGAGCAPCSDGNLLVSVSFPGFLADADQVDIRTEGGTQRFPHARGEPTQTYEVPGSRYVRVTALRGGLTIASTVAPVTAAPGCTPVSVELALDQTTVPVERDIKNEADILFVVDDSPGMAAKQAELKARIPSLLKIVDDFTQSTPHLHIGVITTDVGAGPFTIGQGKCRPSGRGGKLQPVGRAAPAACQPPTGGLNFVDYNPFGKASNLPAGQDLATTLGCMLSVGDEGCEFEQPLEAVYRALHDVPADNHDFLRADAKLLVLFVTDEDDCSADAQSDLFDPAKNNVYGPLTSYRCTEYGVACDGVRPARADSNGVLQNCVAATAAQGGRLTDVEKYLNFLKKRASMGGVKIDPADVILSAISAPSNPFSTAMPNPGEGVLQPSCINVQNAQLIGAPAVRLNQLVSAGVPGQLTSVCASSYEPALESLGKHVVSVLGTGCLERALPDPTAPDCTVEDETVNSDGTVTRTALPKCGTPPCWKLVSSTSQYCRLQCGGEGEPGQHFEMKIDRGSNQFPPAGTTARATCKVVGIFSENRPSCGPPL